MLAAPSATSPAWFIRNATLRASMPSSKPSLPSRSTKSPAKRVGATAPTTNTIATATRINGTRKDDPPNAPIGATRSLAAVVVRLLN